MNIFCELLAWYNSRGDKYRNDTLIEKCVEDFLMQRSKKFEQCKCKSISDLKENVVAILSLMGNDLLKNKNELSEIDTIASEMYVFLSDGEKV